MKKLINLYVLCISISTQASTMHEPPYYCGTEAVYSAVANFNFNNEDEAFESGSPAIDIFEFRGPQVVIKGKYYKYKVDSQAVGAYFNFYNSEQYFLSEDKHRLGDSASDYITFYQRGPAYTWVTRRSDETRCLAKQIMVQNSPTLSSGTYRYESTYGDYTVPNIRYSVDQFSKAGIDSSLPVKVTLTAFNSRSGRRITKQTVKTFNDLSNAIGSLTVRAPTPARGAGLTLTVDDGNFIKAIHLKSMDIPTEPPCRTCAANW
ncbi:hypothetical protein [Bermanella sp. R86510]|uniref:hypothetical protein n=1 Tax=unclassified Bermanella TaxID=2627862 RepID=UPI0037CB8A08